MRQSLFLITLCIYNSLSNAQYVGIGTTTPGSGLEVKGTSLGAQQRITDATSGNSLVLQGGPGSGMKVTGYNYGTATAQPIYLSVDGANTYINPGGGNVGIGTTTPANKLTVYANILGLGGYGIEHTDGTRRLGTFLNSSGGWLGTISNHPLHFFTNDGVQQMTLTQSGQVGIGTTTPTAGYMLDVEGYVRSSIDNATGFVAHTFGGDNSWARFYMRSGPGAFGQQSWFIGTSRNYVGNQLYIGDETNNHTRFSIQPNNGPIYMQGNITQNLGSYGLPKAMLYVNGDGTIIRCYNSITNSSSGGCGFSVNRLGTGRYNINLGFDVSTRFVVISVQDDTPGRPVSTSFEIGVNSVQVNVYHSDEDDGETFPAVVLTDRPVMVIVY